jgi:2-amino-4-hydroxy-6-hydroxymethyldihydropteridine diphosphokinase
MSLRRVVLAGSQAASTVAGLLAPLVLLFPGFSMPVCLVGAGSNLGDRAENLNAAAKQIGNHPQVDVVAISPFYRTSPVGGPGGQEDFLNAALRLDTSLAPDAMMRFLLEVERRLGRRRTQRWGSRTIDLDILLYDRESIDSPGLTIPHPRMAFRRFVLEPAAEIAAELLHPELGWTVGRLLEHLNTAVTYVAVAGLPGAGKSKLAAAVAQRTGARLIPDPVDVESVEHAFQEKQAHLQYLERRVETLDKGGWQEDSPESISDFWLEQTRAYAQSWLSIRDGQEYDKFHDRAGIRAVPAKLLIFLEMDPAVSATRMSRTILGKSHVRDESRLESIRQRLCQQAAAPGRQPVLRLSAAKLDRAVDETVAAVETMR